MRARARARRCGWVRVRAHLPCCRLASGWRGSGLRAALLVAVLAVLGRIVPFGLAAGHGDLLPRVDHVRIGDRGQPVRLRLATAGLEQLRPLVAVAEFLLRDLRQVVPRADRDNVLALPGSSPSAVNQPSTDASCRSGGIGHLQLPARLRKTVGLEDLAVGHGSSLVQGGDLTPPLAVAQLPLGDAPQALRGPGILHRVRAAGVGFLAAGRCGVVRR